MLDEYYGIIGSDNKNNLYYVSNTAPILWTDNITNIKKFISEESAKMDLDDEINVILDTLRFTTIKNIYISRFYKDKELERREYCV